MLSPIPTNTIEFDIIIPNKFQNVTFWQCACTKCKCTNQKKISEIQSTVINVFDEYLWNFAANEDLN